MLLFQPSGLCSVQRACCAPFYTSVCLGFTGSSLGLMNTEISAKGSQLHREQHPLQAYRTTCHPANNLENTGPRDVVYSMIKGSESGNMSRGYVEMFDFPWCRHSCCKWWGHSRRYTHESLNPKPEKECEIASACGSPDFILRFRVQNTQQNLTMSFYLQSPSSWAFYLQCVPFQRNKNAFVRLSSPTWCKELCRK